MLVRILVVLDDSGFINCGVKTGSPIEEMLEVLDIYDSRYTATVWITKDGETSVKDREETERWIREDM